MNVYTEGGATSNKLLEQEYVKERLKSSLRKVCGRDLIKQYEVTFSRMLHNILEVYHIQWHLTLIRQPIVDPVTDLGLNA